jgi:predicted HicB family RNase H-like nuclease
MTKERISGQIVIRVTPSLRARLEQEAERVGLELSSLARLALDVDAGVIIPRSAV